MHHLNPKFEKYLLSLKEIVKREFDIDISAEKMLHDKSHRDNMLVELSDLNNELLNQYIQYLLVTPPYLPFNERSSSVDIPTANIDDDKIVNSPVQGQTPRIKNAKRAWLLSLLLLCCGGLFAWQGGYQILAEQLNGFSANASPSHSIETTEQIIADTDIQKVSKTESIDKEVSAAIPSAVDVASALANRELEQQVSQQKEVAVTNTAVLSKSSSLVDRPSTSQSSKDKAIEPDSSHSNMDVAESKISRQPEKIKETPIVQEKVELNQTDNMVSEQSLPLTENLSSEVSVVESRSENESFDQIKTEIYAPQIKRFILARDVKNREPIGSIENIQFNQANSIRIYAFSDVSGLANDTLYYIWRLNEKEMARVTVEVGASHWRSYSSKRINSTAHGDWTVTLVNKAEDVLAVSRFHY